MWRVRPDRAPQRAGRVLATPASLVRIDARLAAGCKQPNQGGWHVRKTRLALALASLALVAAARPRKAIDVPVPPPNKPTHLLIAALSSADVSLRAAAAWQLAGAKELQPEARAALEPLRTDADRSVRYAAAWALGHLRSPSDAKTATKPDETPPKAIRITRPQYPQAPFNAKVEGTVVVELLIGEEGEVAHLEIRRSIPEFDAAAIACVRQWQFEPLRANGVPHATIAQAPVTFRIH